MNITRIMEACAAYPARYGSYLAGYGAISTISFPVFNLKSLVVQDVGAQVPAFLGKKAEAEAPAPSLKVARMMESHLEGIASLYRMENSVPLDFVEG
jgi:hypothetical protein